MDQDLENRADAPAGTETQGTADAIREAVIERLHSVYDPEIPVDIYELGLIYEVAVDPEGRVAIRMTLTSPMCPAAEQLPPEVEKVATDLGGLRQHLATAAKSTDQMILETRVLLEGLREASSRMSTGLEASIGAVSTTVEGLGAELHGIAESLTKSVDALSQRVTAEDAMKKLNASISELASRMNDLSATQASLAPVLYQLAGPLELRLVPGPRSQPSVTLAPSSDLR